MNGNCGVCNIRIQKNNYLKNRTVCKICYNKNGRKNNNNNALIQNEINTSHQQPKIENVHNNKNNRTLFVGPSFSDKTYIICSKFFHEYIIEIFNY